MAGGKETPRQKMIGMMYLVLTALLALNVSKSILDAFVAIEENIQKANIVQADRGDGFRNDVTEEMTGTKGADQKAKLEKLKYVDGQMQKIDDETKKMIEYIDGLKIDILKAAGEKIDSYKNKDHLSIMWKKQEGVKPIRMNLSAVQGMDKYDEPMHVMGIAEDIKNPKGKGIELWNKLIDFRKKIVSLTASYKMPNSEKSFDFAPKAINEFKDNADLQKKVESMIDGSKANLKEDRQVLIDLYIMLTKLEKNDVHDQTGVHWIGMTFDHAPLVAGIAALSSLQQDILGARALALANYKSKVSTGEFSFNKIEPLAYGPGVVNSGDEVKIKVMMAAYDSDNQPTVTVENMPDAKIDVANGQGVISLKASGSSMKLSGTVAIKNKSGVPKSGTWTQEIIVMEPSGSIELTDLNVLYRGYDNKVEATASGYPETLLTGQNASVSRSGKGYVVRPGSGKTAYLTVSGKDKEGKTFQLKRGEYRVSNLPDPVLYWGAAKSGDKGSRSSRLLIAKYPPEIPLNASFSIVKWTCYAPGLKGAPPTGPGGNIAAAGALINAVPPGTGLSFTCTVRGPDGIARQIGGSWSL